MDVGESQSYFSIIKIFNTIYTLLRIFRLIWGNRSNKIESTRRILKNCVYNHNVTIKSNPMPEIPKNCIPISECIDVNIFPTRKKGRIQPI